MIWDEEFGTARAEKGESRKQQKKKILGYIEVWMD